jgi:formylglycine-generating enzyme required for sulfatase activity/predicted Ser/Thr protein kinase
MGVVYRALDERLNRAVALKVIGRNAAADELRRRFLKEARAASAFTHPNIVTIHEVDTAGEIDFIVMELIAGRSLDRRIAAGALPIDEVMTVAEQIASALAAAHAAGIVHRDIKPANVMIDEADHVKLLDFGIAKQLAPPSDADAATLTILDPTVPGAVLGSVSYMSPEQAQGHAVDGKTDVFSFGVLLYEMLAGRKPFGGTTAVETVAKILEATPPSLETIRAGVPDALAGLVNRCLEKDRNRRPTAIEARQTLAALRLARADSSARVGYVLKRPAVLVPVLVVIAIMIAGGAWWWESGREVRAARRALPAAIDLAQREDSYGFYHAAYDLRRSLPDDPQLRQLWNDFTFPIPLIKSDPPDAEVLTKGYNSPDDAWISLGRTPIVDARFPRGTARVNIVKDGFSSYDGTLTFFATDVVLQPVGAVPEGMTRVPSGSATNEGQTFTVPDFWMDRFEVTNRQFKAFVDAGGYSKAELWREPFIENGKAISWEAGVGRFRDRTGRPGPATWELGSFPQGHADYPVGGVSWYEAAAFAAFSGKSLPTAFQWRRAGDFNGPSTVYSDIVLHSNFGTKGPAAVGSLKGIGPYGQYDMAGNVKEWCWNESKTGRMILGGAWNEPKYMYEDRDAQSPYARLEMYGFRLVKNIDPQPAASLAYVPQLLRDFSVEKPVDDATFALLKGLFAYDRTPLNPRPERVEDAPEWRRETVTIDAAYGNERIIVHLYLPKTAAPPYQPVVYFPGGDAPLLRSSRELNLTNVDFVIRSGRALLYPVYKNTYERSMTVSGPSAGRDVAIARNKDVRRVVDYIETRPDLDADRLAFYGASLGAYHGGLAAALEPRFKALVLLSGGFPRVNMPPEIDLPNFAPRVRIPTLMVNGDSDFQNPLQTSQLPLFRALGVPPDLKRHALFNGGHLPYQTHDIIREILDWFDRFLGPVKTGANTGTN